MLFRSDNFSPDGTQNATVAGQPATIIKMKAIMPKNIPANITSDQRKRLETIVKSAKPVFLTISKAGRILRVQRELEGGKLDVVFTGETFNPTTPMSIFKFTPPAGAKEFVQPTGGMMPNQPGVKRP